MKCETENLEKEIKSLTRNIWLLVFEIVTLIIVLVGVVFLFGCVNAAAENLSEMCLKDHTSLIVKNTNFDDQEKRLYMGLIHYANRFTDEEVHTINDIYVKTGNFADPEIIKIYKSKGLEFLVELKKGIK